MIKYKPMMIKVCLKLPFFLLNLTVTVVSPEWLKKVVDFADVEEIVEKI